MKYLIILLTMTVCITLSASDGTRNNEENSAVDHHSAHNLNHIAIFNGVTTTMNESHKNYTLGIDFVRQFSETSSFGFGLWGEIIFANHKEYALGIPLYYKITDGFWVRTGPGIEILKEEKESEIENGNNLSKIALTVGTDEVENKVKFLYRVGLLYTFHLGPNFGISPSVDFDLVDKNNSLVYGINLGWGF